MNEIEELLEKYFEGETSDAEENQLKDYFSQVEIPDKFKIYKKLFNFYASERKVKINNKKFDQKLIEKITFQKQSRNNRNFYKIIAVAASLILIFGSYLYFKPNTPKQEKKKIVLTSNQKFAINKTIEVLEKVSQIMNRASLPLSNLKYINETNQELKKLNYYNKYNKLVSKYLGVKS